MTRLVRLGWAAAWRSARAAARSPTLSRYFEQNPCPNRRFARFCFEFEAHLALLTLLVTLWIFRELFEKGRRAERRNGGSLVVAVGMGAREVATHGPVVAGGGYHGRGCAHRRE